MPNPKLPYAFVVSVLIAAAVLALPEAAAMKPSMEIVMMLATIYYLRPAA